MFFPKAIMQFIRQFVVTAHSCTAEHRNECICLDRVVLLTDESESVGHYEKLQLQFCPEGGPAPSPAPPPAPAPALPSHGAGLGAFGGWSEPLQPQVVSAAGDGGRGWFGVGQQPLSQPPRARSPPDGQNDDAQPPAACSQHSPPLPKDDVMDASVHPANPNPSGPSALWPALVSPPSLRGGYVPPGDSRLVSPPDPSLAALAEAGGCGGLDIVPASIPPDRGLAGGHETRHPDIIDVWQSNGEGPPVPTQPSPSPPGLPLSSEATEEDRVGQELLHLPDLMGGSSVEPAIIVENTLAQPHPHSHLQDPAIVVESRPAHRLPEVANVHQTAESHALGHPVPEVSQRVGQEEADRSISIQPQEHQPLSCDTPPIPNPVPPTQQPSTTPPPHEASAHSSTLPQSPTPTSQAALPHLTPPTLPTSPPQPLTFSKNIDIGDADLDAELAELEEEQVRLQGAYGGVGGPSPQHGLLQHHPSPKASPDLIGGAGTSNEHQEEDIRNGESGPIAGSPSDVANSPPDSPYNRTDSLHSPPDSSSDTPISPPDPSRSPTDSPAGPSLPGSHIPSQDSPFLQHSGIAGLEEVVCQPQHTPGEETAGERGLGTGVDAGGDNVSTGSLNTDTLSSSSTLTDPGSPDRQPQQPPQHPVPQSPTRVTPGKTKCTSFGRPSPLLTCHILHYYMHLPSYSKFIDLHNVTIRVSSHFASIFHPCKASSFLFISPTSSSYCFTLINTPIISPALHHLSTTTSYLSFQHTSYTITPSPLDHHSTRRNSCHSSL